MFGVIFKHIRNDSIYTYEAFKNHVMTAFHHSEGVTIVSVSAIYDYKRYYDKFIDPKLKILKEENTQHGWRIEKLSYEEEERFPILNAGIKTNYTKSAQTVSFDLRKINPLHNSVDESEAYVFSPVIRISAWLPQDCRDEKERKPGMSFLCAKPVGHPQPLELTKKWYDSHVEFLSKIKNHFSSFSEADVNIVNEWNRFSREILPESQSILDYCFKMGSMFTPPLGEYLYGPRPFGFFNLHNTSTSTNKSINSRVFSTSFSGDNHKRGTLIDKALENIVCQVQESIEWRGNTQPLKAWKFDAPEILSKVIVEVSERFDLTEQQREESGRHYRYEKVAYEGTIVAFCKNDFNLGDIFQVGLLYIDTFILSLYMNILISVIFILS